MILELRHQRICLLQALPLFYRKRVCLHMPDLDNNPEMQHHVPIYCCLPFTVSTTQHPLTVYTTRLPERQWVGGWGVGLGWLCVAVLGYFRVLFFPQLFPFPPGLFYSSTAKFVTQLDALNWENPCNRKVRGHHQKNEWKHIQKVTNRCCARAYTRLSSSDKYNWSKPQLCWLFLNSRIWICFDNSGSDNYSCCKAKIQKKTVRGKDWTWLFSDLGNSLGRRTLQVCQ